MFNITSDTQKGWSFNGDKDSLIAGIAIKRDFYQNYKYTFQKSDRTSLDFIRLILTNLHLNLVLLWDCVGKHQ